MKTTDSFIKTETFRDAGGLGRKRLWPAETIRALAVLSAICCLAIHGSRAVAAPLDPMAFPSLGALNLTEGTYTIDTSGPAPRWLDGASNVVFTGTFFDQGIPAGAFFCGWNPLVAVFDFDSVFLGTNVTVKAVGPNPVALLSRSTARIEGTFDASGERGQQGSGNLGGTEDGLGGQGGAGGGKGGDGGTGTPPTSTKGQNGEGPGGEGCTGAFGGFGGLSARGNGAGFGGRGGGGFGGLVPDSAYGDLRFFLQGGAGGGGTGTDLFLAIGAGGGGGGGGVEIGAALSLSGRGAILANGGTGGGGGTVLAGGGSGGGVLLHAPTISFSGRVQANGGNPNGAGGRILVLTSSGGRPRGTYSVNRGASGGEEGVIQFNTLAYVDPQLPPTVQAVRAGDSFTSLEVVFSEAVDETSAETTGNYSLSSGLTVTAATLTAPDTVRLTTSRYAPDAEFTLTIRGVTDTATPANAIAADTQVAWRSLTRLSGAAKYERWNGASSTQPLKDDPRLLDPPDVVATLPALEAPSNAADNYLARLTALIVPPQTGEYVFFIAADDNAEFYLSEDASPENLHLIATEPAWNPARQWVATDRRTAGAEENRSDRFAATDWPTGNTITLQAGQQYYAELIFRDTGGNDNGAVFIKKASDPDPVNGDPAASGSILAWFTPPQTAAESLVHRYSFTRDARDSVGGADGQARAFGGGALPVFSGGRVLLDGTGGYLDLPNGLVSRLSEATIEAWVTVDNNATWARVFDFGTSSTGELGPEDAAGTGQSYLFLTANAGGTGRARFAITATSNAAESPRLDDPDPFPLGEAVHVAVSYGAATATLYVNGRAGASGNVTVPLSALVDNNVWLGRSQWPDPAFHGAFDEFRIYDRALRAEELAASFAAGPDDPALPGAPSPAFTSITLAAGMITISWTGGGTLESAPTVLGPWTPVTAASSPFATPVDQALKVFRLRQ